jgi:hypothetical protein
MKIYRKPILRVCGRILCQTVTDALCVVIWACATITVVNYAVVILARWTL